MCPLHGSAAGQPHCPRPRPCAAVTAAVATATAPSTAAAPDDRGQGPDLLLAPWRPWPRACRSLALSCVPEPPPHTGTCFTKDED